MTRLFGAGFYSEDEDGEFYCECLRGYSGARCQDFDPCSSGNACVNGGTCQVMRLVLFVFFSFKLSVKNLTALCDGLVMKDGRRKSEMFGYLEYQVICELLNTLSTVEILSNAALY